MTFIDLRGPEKVSKCGSGTEEALAVNVSLCALKNVILALSKGSKYVPYRDHPLTMLMRDVFKSKTLMIVNISPSFEQKADT